MLIIEKELYEKMLAHCMTALPNEACGLLAGIMEGEDKKITNVYLMKNVDESPIHFSMDVKEQFIAYKDARARGEIILGNFHSHPGSSCRPSGEDKRLAYDGTLEYLIISLQDKEQPVLKAFGIDKEKKVTEHEISITGLYHGK